MAIPVLGEWRSLFHASWTKISFKSKQSPKWLYMMLFGRPYCVAARTQIYAVPHHKFLNNIPENRSQKDGFCIKKYFFNLS
jgi:hypothetical protein